jgi:hypothetical protein
MVARIDNIRITSKGVAESLATGAPNNVDKALITVEPFISEPLKLHKM